MYAIGGLVVGLVIGSLATLSLLYGALPIQVVVVEMPIANTTVPLPPAMGGTIPPQ